MKLKPYPKYKPSGVKWIGDIPGHWEAKKLKYLTTNLDSMRVPISSENRVNGEIPYYGATGIIDYVNSYIFDEKLLLIGEDGAPFFEKYKDVAFIINGKSWVNNHAHVLRVKDTIKSELIMHQLNITDYKFYIKGSTRDKLNQDELSKILIIGPLPEEQQQIAKYLDKETSQINSLIKKYQKLIDLLKEKRTALISQVVTKGLNPNVKMKDSGIEWVGEVPEHWGVKRLKRIFNIYNGSTPKSTDPVNWDGDIVWITPDDLGSLNGKYIEDSARNITEVGYKSCGTTLAPKSSIIISTRAPIGHLGIANTTLCTNQGCRSLVPKSRANSSYFYYLLIRAKSKLNSEGQGATFMELSKGKLGMIFLCNPSLEEQKQISDYLNSETSKIDALIEKINKQVKLLRELKTSLISHVVTGKVDVRGVVE